MKGRISSQDRLKRIESTLKIYIDNYLYDKKRCAKALPKLASLLAEDAIWLLERADKCEKLNQRLKSISAKNRKRV